MRDMEFMVRRTTVYNGAGALVRLPELLGASGGHRAVLYTDQGMVATGLAGRVADLIRNSGTIELAGVFDTIAQDATTSVINKGTAFYRECGADCIVALGGGSVLDTSKAIKWMANNGTTDIEDAFRDGKKLERWPEAQPMPIPHIALGTTAGTGCEITGTAVVFLESKRIKISLMNAFIAPDIAIADPELTFSLPPHLTAYTGMDALTHAIEGFFSFNANPVSDMYARQAIEMISDNLVQAVTHGTDLEARNNMLVANIFAIAAFGFAIGNTPVHNMSHTLGAKCRVPHGLANAVLVTRVMRELPEMYTPRACAFAPLIRVKDPSADPAVCFQQVLARLNELITAAGIPEHLDIEIKEEQLDQFVKDVHSDPVGVHFTIPTDVIQKVLRTVSK